MSDFQPKKWLKEWLRPSRIVPLITLIVAGLTIAAGLLKIIELTIVDGIIIALLLLLAADSLSERITILEKIEDRLSNLTITQKIFGRSELPEWEDRSRSASEVSILAVSAISLIMNNIGIFERLLAEGCNFRIILLDPSSSALQTWDMMMKISTTRSDIQTSLQWLQELMLANEYKGKCEIKLSPVFLPFSISVVDPGKDNASMVVEFYTYKTTFADRPHIQISPSSDKRWFDFFVAQFEQVWTEAKPWSP